MRNQTNPYNPDLVVTNMFFGRHQLLTELMTGLDASKSFAICGGRRMGKTMLLKYLESRRIQTRDCAYFDLKGHLLYLQEPMDLLVALQTSVAPLLKGDLATNLLLRLSAVECFEQNIAEAMRTVPIGQLTILIDESDAILEKSWGKDFFSYLRSLVSNSTISGRFGIVLTGGRQLRELARLGGSPFNVATWYYLEPFEYEDTFALATKPIRDKIPRELVERLQQFTGGHPFIAQFLLREVLDDARGVCLETMEAAEAKFISSQSFQMHSWWVDLTEDDRDLYRYLLSEKSNVSLASCSVALGRIAQESMEALVSYGLARYSVKSDTYAANCGAFNMWFARNVPAADTPPSGQKANRINRPETPHTNVTNLRKILRGLEGYIWWVDPHFGTRVFEELNDIDLEQIHQIRILSRLDVINDKAKRDYKRFQEELRGRGVTVEWRGYTKGAIKIHDRYLLSVNAVYNMPPVNTIYEGSYAEMLLTSERPPFDEWWDKGEPL